MSRPIVVLGDALLDIDLLGTVRRVAPDAPVPVVSDVQEQVRPGGAALAAFLAARDGHDVVLVCPLADDDAAKRLLRALDTVSVLPLPYDGATPVKQRIRAGNQSVVRVDTGETLGRIGGVPEKVAEMLNGAAAVLVSDYGRGTTTQPTLRKLLADLPSRVLLVWDPHPRGTEPVPGAHLVTPNVAEARLFASRHSAASAPPGLSTVAADADVLVASWQSRAVAVTRGHLGALLSYGSGAPFVTPAPAVQAVDPCGAGDQFSASATAALVSGAVLTEAVQEGVAAASRYVNAGGPASLLLPDARPAACTSSSDAATLAKTVRASGGVVVATGGCFDLLHAGHVATLRAARQLGDCLIVCVNSDESVRRLKGSSRPLVPAEDRVRVLEALECVDAVMVFDEDTPIEALRRLRPQVWAKGGDYAGAEVPEASVLREWGGQAVALPYLAGRSTTSLVEVAATVAPASLPPARHSSQESQS